MVHGYGPESETTPEQLHKLHAKMDADANGKLSLDEILHFYGETQRSSNAKEAPILMEEMDEDKNGKLSLEEIFKSYYGMDADHHEIKQLKAREGDKFKAADKDSNGLLDEKEFAVFFNPDVHAKVVQVMAQHEMEDKDEDKDGFLTIDEFWGKLEGGDERGEHDVLTFNKIDKDGSGKIDKQELVFWESGHIQNLQDMESFIQLADTDSDHHVTIEELHAVHGKEENNAKEYFMEMVTHHEL